MTTIHHATLAKAEKEDIILDVDDKGRIYAENSEGETLYRGKAKEKAKDVLAKAIEARDKGETEEAEETEGMHIKGNYRAEYRPNRDSNGDGLADRLRSHLEDDEGRCDPAKLEELMKENGIEEGRWGHLNTGQRRMGLGNVLRGKIRRGEDVFIAGHKIRVKIKGQTNKGE